jgi:hypothetical protein
VKICECGDVVRDDGEGHEDPSRDTHRAVVVDVAAYEQGPPPDPRERAVAEAAAALVDSALPPPPLAAGEREAASRPAHAEGVRQAAAASGRAALPREDEDLL